ncbi:hypothetical protein CEXT_637061 [Caerostris extrusa]|uniref:Uncharacterized protein n=1 Tax=Caerostris extrusa TaxID=172846 RepID=A0AAV4TEC1_CAEEX|nr:hypothetical protein CEXT_637061 [Caerostris extrusa]
MTLSEGSFEVKDFRQVTLKSTLSKERGKGGGANGSKIQNCPTDSRRRKDDGNGCLKAGSRIRGAETKGETRAEEKKVLGEERGGIGEKKKALGGKRRGSGQLLGERVEKPHQGHLGVVAREKPPFTKFGTVGPFRQRWGAENDNGEGRKISPGSNLERCEKKEKKKVQLGDSSVLLSLTRQRLSRGGVWGDKRRFRNEERYQLKCSKADDMEKRYPSFLTVTQTGLPLNNWRMVSKARLPPTKDRSSIGRTQSGGDKALLVLAFS